MTKAILYSACFFFLFPDLISTAIIKTFGGWLFFPPELEGWKGTIFRYGKRTKDDPDKL